MRRILAIAALAAAAAACTQWMPPGPGPGPIPGGGVAGTNWRVVAVNNRATPRMGEFYMRFQARTFGAKFGCNGIGGDYIQRGNIIDPGATTGTLMACPDMTYEAQGSAVLQQDMRANWNGPRALRLANRGGTIDLRR